jgi:glycosyltransferase involved in cell wall biosynthesis
MTGARILLFAPSAYPLGGVATWASYLLPGLRARGFEPTFALTSGRHHDPKAYLAVHPFSPAVAVPCGAGTQAARVRHAAAAITAARPDIVAFANLPDVALAAQRLRRQGGFAGKLVWIEHGIDRQSFIDARSLSGALDAFVATNQLGCELARGFAGFAPARVFYAPYGVAPSPAVPRPRRDSNAKLNLLYAGRLEAEQKRVQDLPRLADELARRDVAFRLVIAGAGSQEAGLRRHFAASPHEVAFLGFVPPEALTREVLPQADALLVLSCWETGPLVAFEAMAAGVPVVTSRFFGSHSEAAFVEEGNCLMFRVGDMGGAAQAIARLRDPALARRLAHAGHALVADRYSRDVSIRRWDEVLRAILALPALARQMSPERLAPAGRLERWLGPRAGERLSSLLGRAYRHREPGGEWPHWLAPSQAERDDFQRALSAAELGVCV